jgi:hypothetical protein
LHRKYEKAKEIIGEADAVRLAAWPKVVGTIRKLVSLAPSCSFTVHNPCTDNFKANEEKLKATVAQAQEACAQGNEVRAEPAVESVLH